MSKVDKARDAVYLRTVYPGDYTVIDKLIQAVRDEELAASRAAQDCDGIEGIGKMSVCTLCPAKGTRYCP